MLNDKSESQLLLDNKFGEKIKQIKNKKKMHLDNENKLKLIYYSSGFLFTTCSSLVTFLTGYNYEVHNTMLLVILILSAISTTIGSLITFSQIEQKISEHHQSYLGYCDLLQDIDNFMLQIDIEDDQNKNQFYKLIIEKMKILINHELNSCFS